MMNPLWSILISTQKSIQKKLVRENQSSFLIKAQVLQKLNTQI